MVKRRIAMKFEKIKVLGAGVFRRITGVKKSTFDVIVEVVREAEKKQKEQGGRPNKLSIEDRVLMMLEYYREYRTYAHIGASYGISESNAYKTICFIEKTLVASKLFRLPGKKALLEKGKNLEMVLIDATETPIERPKKNKKSSTQARKKDTP